MRQYNRDRPYEPEHRGSLARKGRQPHTFEESLVQFVKEFREEIPDRLHTSGVWRDRVSEDEARNGIKATGGSALGTPRSSEGFRSYIEDSPFATQVGELDGHKELDGHYKTPIRAALARLGGRGPDNAPFPFMARALYRTALRDGDYDGACRSLAIPEPVREVYITEALRRLWTKYEVEPPARTVRESAA